MRLLRCLCLVAFLAAPAVALAADEDQVKLTAPMIENFITAHAELAALAGDLTKQYGDRSDTPGDDPVASLPAYSDIAEAKARIDALLSKYGYKDFDELEVVTDSVMLAYQADIPDGADDDAHAAPEKSPADLDAEKAKAKADVEADASLTPDKKKEALQQIDDQYASLQALTPLPGNADIVKPYLDRLKPIADAN
ncbi:hypothetical protein [Labrys monachus]|uniref:Uncharacterized protein n=1 Tax=Labrys monachus TaxID=217067 RepID=A0ABU0FGQ9_9HYPH|nr:hypothetical protein [Labrys monachus]MDQ0393790.1 hypothetical protein [Labrys monachus]